MTWPITRPSASPHKKPMPTNALAQMKAARKLNTRKRRQPMLLMPNAKDEKLRTP